MGQEGLGDGPWRRTRRWIRRRRRTDEALVLPGGQLNPDLLQVEPKALKFIKDIFDAKKIVAAVCHAQPSRARGAD